MSSSSRPPNISMDLAPNHPFQPEEAIPPFGADVELEPLDPALRLPASATATATGAEYSDLLLGCATFGYGVYESAEHVRTPEPLRIVAAALDAGVNGFDTSPHYHPSETILGHALHALRERYPRASYKLLTKAGKYGPRQQDHVYEPGVVRASVERSLARLQTPYLDVVYLHDVEFVASFPFPAPAGDAALALATPAGAAAWGLAAPYEARGEGDAAVLAAFAELRALQAEGKVRQCGLAGYPLPTLLRLCRLLAGAGATPDVVQTYAHYTLQNAALAAFLPAFAAAGVRTVINAAPLSMGLLTSAGPPAWHPAAHVPALRDAARDAAQLCTDAGGSIEQEGLRFGYRRLAMGGGAESGGGERTVPCVIGCCTREQLLQTLQTFKSVRRAQDTKADDTQGEAADTQGEAADTELGRRVQQLFRERGALGVSWQKPAPEEMV